jgi:TPR repeat protein
MNWYRLAAEKNDAKGQYKMGKMYQKGGGVAIDYKLAMDWYLKAAAQNNSKATKAIGGLFENGLGVPVDSAKANEWNNKGRRTSWFKKR